MNIGIAKFLPAALLVGTMITSIGLAPQAANAQRPFWGADQTRRHQLVWSGDVDDTTIVSIRDNDVEVRDVNGKASINVNSQVFGRLPQRPVDVFLKRAEGRGEIRVIREPNPDKDYTARVLIKDPQSGRGHYFFVLGWRPIGV